jgi:hypothetical protein
VHFVHNAEFVRDYPNMPASWSRAGVYMAWLALAGTGIAGWLLLRRGWRIAGLGMLAVYALLGLDSLGHYVLAPFSAHSAAMNATILLEVASAALVLAEVTRQFVVHLSGRRLDASR